MKPQQLDAMMAAILDGIDVESIVQAVFKCGGEGSGVPGPCPEGGGKDRPMTDKPARRRRPEQGGSGRIGRRGEMSETHRQLLNQHMDRLRGHLDAANLPKRQAKQYRSAAEAVLKSMTEDGLKRLTANIHSYRFYDSVDAVDRECRASEQEQRTVGFYRTDPPSLHLDGPTEGRSSVHSIYAHEYTHALDGPNDEISQSKEWQEAWEEELQRGLALGEDGAIAANEGLAVLGEYMLRGRRAEAALLCPKCVKIWEDRKL